MKKKIHLLLATTLLLACGDGNKPAKFVVPMPPKGKFNHGEKGCRGRGHHHGRLREEMDRLFASEDINVLNPEFKALQSTGEALMAKIKAAAPLGVTLSSDQQAEVVKLQSLADEVQAEAIRANIFSLQLKGRPAAVTKNVSDYVNTKTELEAYEAQLSTYSPIIFKDFKTQLRPVSGRVHRHPGVRPDEANKYVWGIKRAVRELTIRYEKAAEAYNNQIAVFRKQVEEKKEALAGYLEIFGEKADTGITTFVQDEDKQGSLELQGFNFEDVEDVSTIVDVIKDQRANIEAAKVTDVVNAIYAVLISEGAKFRNDELIATNEASAKAAIAEALKSDDDLGPFFVVTPDPIAEEGVSLALSSGSIKDLSGTVSFRDARTSLAGRVDGRGLSVNGVSGQAVELAMPLFVNVKGNVDSAKATEAATGSVAYRLGNTVIGAIQGYANSGAGFELDGHQLESSVVASHSFGGLFIEGQAGSVAAASVHGSDWNGVRSQFTVGFDTSIVSPFVQVAYRQLDRDGLVGEKDTAAYVGVDMEVANLTADTYSLTTRLLTKVGYGEKSLSAGTKDLGSSVEVRGSVEWTAGVNLNSGVSFSTNLGLDTLSGSSAGVKLGLDR